MKISIFLLLPVLIFAEDFISHYEYGQMLYNNPRGVSCQKCHGKAGEGGVISSYKNKEGKIETITAPNITNVSLTDMIKSLNATHKIMPKYYLTNQEIKTIYDYIQQTKGN
jgi:mono/diheme cytochrome c family protein